MPLRTFTHRSSIAAPADALFAWHERLGAFERLDPPWDPVRVVEKSGGIEPGARVVLDVRLLGPIATRWVVEHRDYHPGRMFRDVQIRGPFASWVHTHLVEAADDGTSALEDRIEFALPLASLGDLVGHRLALAKLRRLFRWRHCVTAADLERHGRFAHRAPMTIAVTGATGFLGSALVPYLTTAGHRVLRIGRGESADVRWDPSAGRLDGAPLEGIDAVVHLAGESIAQRWTSERKREIRDSRVNGTRLIAETLAALAKPPRVLISTSAVGIYGDRKDEPLDEASTLGRGFLPDVAREWEGAAEPARQRGIRVVHPRLGIILSPGGGALAKLLPIFSVGAGGRIGDGTQWMSWVARDDVLGALEFALHTDTLNGPVNVTAPAPATNAEFARTLGEVLHRPAFATVPAMAVRLLYGEMGEETVIAGQKVLPRKITDAGFTFRHPTLAGALAFELGR